LGEAKPVGDFLRQVALRDGEWVGLLVWGPAAYKCPAPRLFVGTGQVQRRIISWELARGARDNLTMGRA